MIFICQNLLPKWCTPSQMFVLWIVTMKCALIAAISGVDTSIHRSSIDLFWRLNCCQSAIFRLQWTRRQTLTFSPYVGEYIFSYIRWNYPKWENFSRLLENAQPVQSGPDYPFLWGHPVVPINGDISKNRHIAAYGKKCKYCISCVCMQNRKELHDVNFLLGHERKVR